jgi:hypothetical protein
MTMTVFQREGLHLLGYTKRESEFLFLVATHSGNFTNRQFKCFAETESGSVSHAFVQKLLARKHASYHAYRSGGRVYHLFARKVYQAIERENLRTRKKHELHYVKTRLVALDFVLAHQKHRYLETEAEKVAFFETEWNVSREILPAKQYRARRSAEITPRYFVDRFPMFVDRLSSPPVVSFTYVDAVAVTLEAFGTHLRAYLGSFQSLPKFTAEIQIHKENVLRFEARQQQNGLAAVTIRDLLKATLRHRPDRIIVDEIRGGEAFDLLQLLNTGHSETISSVHADSAAQAVSRFTTCVLQSGVELPYRAIKTNIAESLNLIIHLERRPGCRTVTEVAEIQQYDPDLDRFEFEHVLVRKG